jgi:hypothetical protein
MSILGLTIDYGPYGWLEDFDTGWTPNTTDASGRRYRFGQRARCDVSARFHVRYRLLNQGSTLPSALMKAASAAA